MRDTLGQDERLLGSTFDDGDDSLPGGRTDQGLEFGRRRLRAESAVASGAVVDPDGVEGAGLVRADQSARPVVQTLVGFAGLKEKRHRT